MAWMSRRRLLGLAAVTLGLGSLGFAQNKVSITYLTHWPPQQVERLKAAIARYQKVDPNTTINVRAVPFGNLLSTLRAQAGSSSGPTIIGIYDLWLPELVRDGIADAAQPAYASDIRANWPAGSVQNATVGQKVYGYPNEVDLYALIYNKALFKEAGITAPPKNWVELTDYAQRLTQRDGSGKITQQGFGLINSWTAGAVHPFLALATSNGQTLLQGTKPQLTRQGMLEVAELYKRLIQDAKVTDPSMGTADANTTGPYLQNFVNGNTAMIIMANWWEGPLKDAMGEKFADVATAAIPVGPSGSKSRTVSYTWSNIVNAKASAAQKAAAWKFLRWLNSPGSGTTAGASAMGDLLMAMGILPSRNSDLKAFAGKLNTPFLKGYVDQIPSAVPFPIVLGGQELSAALQKAIEQIQFGQAEPAAALATAQSEAEKILGRYYK